MAIFRFLGDMKMLYRSSKTQSFWWIDVLLLSSIMELSTELKIEIITLCLRGEYTQSEIVNIINEKYGHPLLRQSTISKLLKKFKETGSVQVKKKSGRPPISEQATNQVMAQVRDNVHLSVRAISREIVGIGKSTVWKILKMNKFHPYKMKILCKLQAADYANRVEFCNRFLEMVNNGEIAPNRILWTDESLFSVNGLINKQNYRYWSQDNPHWMSGRREQTAAKIMVWTGIIGEHVIGPFFFEDTVTQESYLDMLTGFLMPELERLNIDVRTIRFMQDGAPAHFALSVREWLNINLPNWIGRGGPMAWPARSPDLTPLDFFLWGFVKFEVYKTKPHNLAELRQRIEAAHQKISPEMLERVYEGITHRIRLCLADNGGHIERFR